MSSFRTLIAPVALVLCAAGAVHAGTTGGAGENLTNPAGVCQAALPAYEGAFRKRPLAVQNEGTSSAFVTCSLTAPTQYGGNQGTRGLQVSMINNTAEEKIVNCTVVLGSSFTTPTYYTRTVTLLPNDSDSLRLSAEEDNAGVSFNTYAAPSVSCNVPAGVGIAETYVWWSTTAPVN